MSKASLFPETATIDRPVNKNNQHCNKDDIKEFAPLQVKSKPAQVISLTRNMAFYNASYK